MPKLIASGLLALVLTAQQLSAASVTSDQIMRAATLTEEAETSRDGSVPIIGERLGRTLWLDDHNLAYEAVDGRHRVAVRIVDARTGSIRPADRMIDFEPSVRWPNGADQPGSPGPGWVSSPDKVWRVENRGANLAIIREATKHERALTGDGTADNAYGDGVVLSWSGQLTLERAGFRPSPSVLWSPDSRSLLSFRSDARKTPLSHFVETVPRDDSDRRPIHYVTRTPFPGEPAPLVSFMVFDAATGRRTDVSLPPTDLFPDPIRSNNIWWSNDGNFIYLRLVDAKRHIVSIWRIVASSGKAVLAMSEQVKSSISNAYEPNDVTRALDSGELLFYSQRDDFGHIYRYSSSGQLLNKVTSGQLYVSSIVTTKGDWVYFLAGREDSPDPYKQQLFRVRIDGKEQEQLTRDDAQHEAEASPGGAYFILQRRYLDRPPEAVLAGSTGETIATLATGAYARGAAVPERISALGRDGRTRIFGTLFKPSDFDPAKRYPVIHYVYGAPQATNAPLDAEDWTSLYSQALAELGFIVLTADGMGTPGRTKSFNDLATGPGFRDCGLPDAIAVMRALAKDRAYIDMTRVGINGISGGGYCSARAMLDYPDVFAVAVSISGSHDQGLIGNNWGENYVGLPKEHPDYYRLQDNAAAAGRLKGKLLLIHGELDDDTNVANTMRMVGSLVKSHREFDMLILPGANHSIGEDRYVFRRVWDYFIRNLAHTEGDVFSFEWPDSRVRK